MKFVSFPSIEGFHNAVKLTRSYPHLASSPINYKGKIKLHGTNSCVNIDNGTYVAQSRTQLIDEKNDNAGFARWVNTNKEYWSSLKTNAQTTIFGEWCGPGIQSGTAIQQIPNKIFAVFAIMVEHKCTQEEYDALVAPAFASVDPNIIDEKEFKDAVDSAIRDAVNEFEENKSVVISEPDEIKAILGNYPKDVYILPWVDGENHVVDFLKDDLTVVVNHLNEMVNKIEPCDPWVKSTFGVDGIAEGIVYYPSVDGKANRKLFTDFAFKAKGEKHKVTKTKDSVQIDPEVAKNIDEFADMFVTPARIEQGAGMVGGFNMKNVGNFLKWINADIQKESVAELEASNLTWDNVQSKVQNVARLKFIEEAKKV